MLLFKEKQKNKNSLRKYFTLFLNSKNKKIFSKSILFIVLIIFACIPLDAFFGKNNKYLIPKLANYLSYPFSKVNKIIGFGIYEYVSFAGSPLGIFSRFLKAFPVKNKVINLSIKLDDLSKINYLRKKAINQGGILIRSKDDEVDAKIEFDGNLIPVKVRLKGDYVDHLLGHKWSYRVKVKDDKSFDGMKEFSLQHPRTRLYLNEFIFFKLLDYEEIPNLRYEFVTLKLNGKNLGTYALEEHFTKFFVERNKYREGPLIKISEDSIWEEWKKSKGIDGNITSVPTNLNYQSIDLFNSKKVFSDKAKISQYLLANEMLEKFLLKKISASDIFDLKLAAKYFAVVDMVQANHALGWRNMRFYFNPITSRFIPVGYDASISIRNLSRTLSIDSNPLGIFDDIEFAKIYIQELERIGKEDYINRFFIESDKEIEEKLSILNKTFPQVRFLKNEFLNNAKNIRNRLSPIDPLDIKIFKVENSPSSLNVKIQNRTNFPIQINSVVVNGQQFLPVKNAVIKTSGYAERNTPINIIFNTKNKTDLSLLNSNSIIVNYRLYGSSVLMKYEIEQNINLPITKTEKIIYRREANLNKFPFLKKDENANLITLNRGDWVIDKPLVLPAGYKFIIEEGTKVLLKDKGMIISKGPLIFKGSKSNPIEFLGLDDGNSIFVSDSKRKSLIQNTIFKNLNAPPIKSISLTGAITFFNSPVEISDSQFLSTKSEDFLNLFRSNFSLKNNKFTNTASDALDVDFSDGLIYGNQFEFIGNDAIDISGSDVQISAINIDNAGDKAISIGEKSKLNGSNVFINNSAIGIASKDLSEVKLKDVNINNTKLCVTAYQKKPEFGPASINIKGINNSLRCQEIYLLESGSVINMPDEKLLPNSRNLKKLLYPDESN